MDSTSFSIKVTNITTIPELWMNQYSASCLMSRNKAKVTKKIENGQESKKQLKQSNDPDYSRTHSHSSKMYGCLFKFDKTFWMKPLLELYKAADINRRHTHTLLQ